MPSIRKRNGKWQVQIRRKGFGTVCRSFALKSDGLEWAREKERQADRNELLPNLKTLSATTLGELVTRYRDEVVPTKKGSEIETIILNAFLRDPICRKPLSEITPSDFADYRDKRLKVVTSKSLKRQFAPIHNMFEVARNEWGLPFRENPLDKVKLKAVDNKRERRLRAGELERIKDACKVTRNPIVLQVILFAIQTAMRRGEILALNWEQVDLERRSVTVLESKNGHSRKIPLTRFAEQIIISQSTDNKRVFPITANALKLSWVRIMSRARIVDLHFHDLRHEAVSRFFEMGLTVPEVGSISGHRDARMLMRYAHSSTESLSLKLGQ